MRKKLIIDIRDYVDREEEASLTETIRKHKKAILRNLIDCIDQIPLHDPHITSKVSYKLDVKNREVIVTYEWDEQSNVNTWMYNVDKNLIRICDYLWANTPFKCHTV